MSVSKEQLLEAGCHFGHLTRKWNPKMAPYIFMEQDGIHIIDLNKTGQKLDEATSAVRNFVKSGKKIMFVATKKQAKDIIQEAAKQAGMPFVTERWLGGMLTNFATVRKSIKKMQTIDKMANDGTYANINKKEKLMLEREKAKTIGYYGMFELNNGFRKTLYWSKEKMESHALQYSKGYQAKKGYTFWEKDFDGMAFKTMLRQIISKWGVMSIELQTAFESDMAAIKEDGSKEYVDNDMTSDFEQVVVDTTPKSSESKTLLD
jgi:ribosomal protein S2